MRHLRTLAALATVASISMPLHAAAAISAQQLNNTFQQDTLAGQWAGGDAAITIPGPSHNTWWLFGDTITETHPDYFQWTPSSALLINNSDPGNTQPVTHFDGDTPIPSLLPSTGGTKFWPSSTAPHPRHSGRHIVSGSTVSTFGPGQWDFSITGSSLFDIEFSETPTPTTRIREAVPTPQASTSQPIHWGSALVLDDTTLYIFGSQEGEDFGKKIHLARVPHNKWTEIDDWQFFNGSTFTPDPENSTPILPASAGMPHTFSVIPHPTSNGWLMVAKQYEVIGDDVVALASHQLTGSWGKPVELFKAAPRGDLLRYFAVAHPKISCRGTLLVGVSQNLYGPGSARALYDDPTSYRPFFHVVPLRLLPKPPASFRH